MRFMLGYRAELFIFFLVPFHALRRYGLTDTITFEARLLSYSAITIFFNSFHFILSIIFPLK